MRIRKVGVVGSGTMGGAIAALAASAGVPVVMLDLPGREDKLELVKKGLERQLASKPASFMDKGRAALIELGTTEELEKLKDCDWIVEVIIEKPEPKQELFARLEALGTGAIVSSNTSGIPMKTLLEGRGEAFRRRFLGTHFFAPVRYLHLLELIPTPETDPAVLETMRNFGERILGKGTVICKDAPGFIANRLGVYGMSQAMRLMMEEGLTIDEVDALTGPLVGRPKSATFRTGDISGLDVLKLVSTELSQTTGEDFAMPEWVEGLIAQGNLGEKTGAGFYKKVGKDIYTYDYKTGEYRPQEKLRLDEIAAIKDLPLAERLRKVGELPGKYGAFARKLFLTTAHYTLQKADEIAYDIVSIDRALEWGFAWEQGPFKNMDAVGLDYLRQGFAELGLPEPELLKKAQGSFYKDGQYLGFDGRYHPIPKEEGVIRLSQVRSEGRILLEGKEYALLDLGDGVALFENRAKMGTWGEGSISGLHKALDWVEAQGYAGLVIGHEDPRTFSAGANLALVLMAAQEGAWDDLELATRRFQQTAMRLRRSPFPVVAAPFGLTLGGGAEFSLHASAIQAHAELYMGLVEVGVGLLPAGGGTKEMLFRFTRELSAYGPEIDLFEGVKRAFQLIMLAQTSTSALEARNMGFLRQGDGISMNRDRLIADAKRRVLFMAPDFVPEPPMRVRALGNQALGNLRYALWQFHEARQASEHDVFIGHQVAYVLCGGDGPPREVSEQDILDLEREGFLKLLGTKKTQERIAHTLKTGKPLRN
ncbi:MAG: 3-hydroxyacyl-CoA dehydrogenase/enoyl-CoA hydratase family protein [Meiothermus sp.]|uniref:3-hydroxyacyl-CoA dehydrogenase/enoyl-CoA hydratase family protein n=1 Tax=Meiothermus sp. TaxID=1955249 RepID=UPI0025EE6418|nr:3-hydroxyacyl-CoA dehydrogenase/enoyl-CoA hydratase family protein [Meiothermus sp.]MCS7058703.1 3-hydroxyacyl-CoA dehydrogenase/enoyl-CoA hydratase family protein [Meiothermus sp.]MCS7195232.1 3-hydroxyacyl-CoA dehydrogenase/enoyl-CoA hydratase family protein [Meiothermus sp.]MDW8089970.1 3-hydroxyacyl-CoA dehydrogenase/enoyl-CoA hydratase family protein [Meiothermus sp.]